MMQLLPSVNDDFLNLLSKQKKHENLIIYCNLSNFHVHQNRGYEGCAR